MSRIRLTWTNASTTIVEQRVYRSISPLDFDDMPEPLAVLPRGDREYLDSAIVGGLTYYYAVSSVLPDYSELISDEIKVEATPGADPHWDKVVALLHFDGDLKDEKGGEWSVTGSPIFVNGRFSQGLETDIATPVQRVESPSGIYFGTDDFAIELFAKRTDVTKQGTIFDFRASNSTNTPLPLLDMNSDGSIGLWIRGVYRVRTPQNTLTTSFKHIALTKNNGNFRLFVDGILQGSYLSDEALPISTLKLSYNMRAPAGNWAFVGVYDELRITKGVARYTENFTPPNEPFPNN